VKSTYECISSGIPYKNINNEIIPCSSAEIRRYQKTYYANNRVINNRFKSLLTEFQEYLKTPKGDDQVILAPLETAETTRENPPRNAKGDTTQVGRYAAMCSSSNSDGYDYKKKIGKKEVNKTRLYFYLFIIFINNLGWSRLEICIG
jgi:hypothetical protein